MDEHDRGKSERAWQAALQLERDVAAIYRTLGARVSRDVSLAGNQIDLLVSEKTTSGSSLRTAVECKAYSRPLGVSVVNSFGAVAYLLRQRELIDKAVLLSSSGFSKQAREAAAAHLVELLELEDLRQRVHGREREVARFAEEEASEGAPAPPPWGPAPPKRIFVVMPFGPGFDDVYVLGIRETAEKLGVVVERADDVQHNGDILALIQKKIREADAVVGDTTGNNPNVFYEIGYAHACDVPTILITRKGSNVPFDLQSINHIFFDTIVELRGELEQRLKHTLGV